MKASEIRACDFCKKPVAGNTRDGKAIDFHRIVLERHLLDQGAISRHAGLAMMLGGDEGLAGVMGLNEQWTIPFERTELLICNPCWYERMRGLHELGDTGKPLPTPEADQHLARARR